jgi:hypothetical protein
VLHAGMRGRERRLRERAPLVEQPVLRGFLDAT